MNTIYFPVSEEPKIESENVSHSTADCFSSLVPSFRLIVTIWAEMAVCEFSRGRKSVGEPFDYYYFRKVLFLWRKQLSGGFIVSWSSIKALDNELVEHAFWTFPLADVFHIKK